MLLHIVESTHKKEINSYIYNRMYYNPLYRRVFEKYIRNMRKNDGRRIALFRELVNVTLAICTGFAYITLTYALFRISLRDNFNQLIIIGVFMGAINYYLKEVMQSPLFLVSEIGAVVLLLIALRGYPLIYAFLVCMTGFLLGGLFEAICTYGSIMMDWTTTELIRNDFTHNSIARLVLVVIELLLAACLVNYRIGFSFVVSKFSGKHVLKTHNFIWMSLLLITIVIMQLGVIEFEVLSLHGLIILLLFGLLLGTLLNAYSENAKVNRDRYGD